MSDTETPEFDGGNRVTAYLLPGVVRRHARTHASRLPVNTDRVSTRLLACLVVLVHGVLDGLVTIGAVIYTQGTVVEANPVLRDHLFTAFRAYNDSGARDLTVFGEPLAVKIFLALFAAGLIVQLPRFVSQRVSRVFAAIVVLSGLFVVASNLVVLAGGV